MNNEEIEQFINDARDAINLLMLDYNKRMQNDRAAIKVCDGKVTPVFWGDLKISQALLDDAEDSWLLPED